jgi:hypothetical protein
VTAHGVARRGRSIAVPLLLSLFAACDPQAWQERVTWSPDGRRAAVLAGRALYVSDAEGRLSTQLADDVEAVAWLGVSDRLVIARTREVATWREASRALAPERVEQIAENGKTWLRLLQLLRGVPEPVADDLLMPRDADFDDIALMVLFLLDHDPQALRDALTSDQRDELESVTLTLHSLLVVHAAGDHLEVDAALGDQLRTIRGIRPAPGGRLVAFATQESYMPDDHGDAEILVVRSDGSAAPTTVASQTTGHFDWTPDGRAIVYLTSNSWEGGEIFGRLSRCEVLEKGGNLEVGVPAPLARAMFARDARVRCLRDGRVLFAASRGEYPSADLEAREERLFVFSGTTSPPTLSEVAPAAGAEGKAVSPVHFDVSPDGTQVLVAGRRGEVLVLPLHGGPVTWVARAIPEGTKGRVQSPEPAWRTAGEFTYARVTAAGNELVLRRGDSEVVLSRNWDPKVVGALVTRQP